MFMLEAPKYVRSNRLLRHARSSEVYARSISFSLPCSENRSMHGRGSTVYSVMLGASKYARPRINRLLGHARSIEVCTEQPYTWSCSEHRSMYGATVYLLVMLEAIAVYSVMLGAPKCARSNRILSHARSIEVCTEQPFT